MRLFFAFVLCLVALPAFANEKLDYTYFEQLPVLDNGRVKPLGAFAGSRLKDFYGQRSIDGMGAVEWLADTVFNPASANELKVFLIKDDALKTRLGVDLNIDHFNLVDLQLGLEKTRADVVALLQGEQGDLTPEQQGLLKIHENVTSYNELLRSFSLILPLYNDETFQSLLPREQKILVRLKSIVSRKGQDINSYNEDEKKAAMMGFQLQQIRSGGLGNDDLKVIPSHIGGDLEWIAPWQIINEGKGSPETAGFLSDWEALAEAYRGDDVEKWNAESFVLLEKTLGKADALSLTRLKVELLYQSLHPYHIAMLLYAAGVLFFLTRYRKVGCFALCAALVVHVFAILARIYILDRPPVGTLYESVLFVSFVCAFISFLGYMMSRKPIMPIAGQIAALGLLGIAPVMLQSSDSLELLVAVLNTNFWLSTHVLCITVGYGVSVIAACLAHAYLFLRFRDPAYEGLGKLFQGIHKISLVALLFTAVGTVLGGIWADQSWGRFWGWDPKENGALFIVLWIIWMQHGRLSGNVRPLGYVAGIAALNVIVALAWFGVNLLGVGLHSYGFTSGIAEGLAVFCFVEVIIISSFWFFIRKQENGAKA